MSVAIEQAPAPFLVTVRFRDEPSSPAPTPTPVVRSSDVVVPFGWATLSASELADLTWEDADWQ